MIDYLDCIASRVAVDRKKSIQYETGFVFDPVFTNKGEILSLYTETDATFRERIKRRINQ